MHEDWVVVLIISDDAILLASIGDDAEGINLSNVSVRRSRRKRTSINGPPIIE